MKDYKEYLKSKAKPIRGSATLEPPTAGQDALQSIASMAVMDLISEGPIYGLIDKEGKKPNNINLLESVYLEDTSVLDRSTSQAQIRTVDFDQIQMMGRLTSGNIETAFNNISGELVAPETYNINNSGMSVFKKEEIGQDKQALLEFLEENKSLSRFGFIQFKLNGIFPHTDNIYSRISSTTNQFDSSAPVDPATVTDFRIEWSDGTNTFKGTATIAMQAGASTPTQLRSEGSLKWNVAYTNSAGNAATATIFKQDAGNGNFFWHFGELYSYATSSTNGNDTSLAIAEATSTSEDFPWVDRESSIWYQYPGAANLSPAIAWKERNVKLTNFNAVANEIYNATIFDLDVYNGAGKAKRSIQQEDGRVVEIPSSVIYGYQVLNDSKFGTYTAAPNVLDVNQAGKVGKQYLIDGFAGGGIYFFEIGDNEEEASAGVFNTGKFFAQKGVNVPNTLQSGLDNGYDVFVYDSATGPISLESPSSSQLSPIRGEIAGKEIGLGYISDLNFKYNYGNVDFDFRNGFETQPTMEGHDEGVQDFDIRKKLFGPLSYGGDARAGDGQGYSDPRQGGDFSNWMINPPLENDAYPYTHTVKRIDVKKCTPTIAIEGLSDIIADGNDAGVQRSETLLISYRYGFKGGVSGVVSDLLAAGNNIQNIALGLFEQEDLVRYAGIVTSNYLDTYSGIGDLPKNKSLKSVTVDDTDIPGLTQAMIDQYGYTSGDLIFPGEEWKNPNRFVTVEKKSFETDSTLITRECSLSYISESIQEPFSYPLVATAGTIFDARNFAVAPSRDFEVRGKLIAIPSNYEPLNADGSDKRFISSSKKYGLRSIQTFDGGGYGKVYDHIDLGTSNFEIEARIGFGSISTTTSDPQYIVDMDGGSTQANRVAIFQRSNAIMAVIRKSTLTDGEAKVDFELVTSIAGRNNEHQYSEWEYINNAQNLTISVPKVIVTDGADGKDIDIQFDYLIGDNVTDGAILWTNSPQRLEIKFNSDGRINMQAAGRSANGTNKDGNDTIITTTVSSVNSNSTRIFRKFEFVQFKIEGNLLDGITLKDVSKDPPETIVELTSSQLANMESNSHGMVIINGLFLLGVNSQNTTVSRKGSGAIRNLSVQGTDYITDTYDVAGVVKRFRSDPSFLTVGNVNPADVYDISLKAVGKKYTLEVKVGDEVVGTSSNTMSTPRGNIQFGGTTNNLNADSPPYLFMGFSDWSSTTKLKAGTKLSDLKIRKNNQLIHHWDGTVIDTVRYDNCIKDRVGGFHADLAGTANAVLDSNFTFGKNRERIYNGPWDGTFKLGWSDNPAWILYDIMSNPIYGVGNAIDDREDINIFNLYKIAQYCDAVDNDGYFDGLSDATRGLEPRFSCNLRIYEPKNAFEVIGNIASVFRGFTYWDGVGLNFAIDNEKEISAIFNNGNVHDGIFSYGDITSSARFTKVEVVYSDRSNLYGNKSEYIEDEDGIRKYGIITKMLNGIGSTSKSQARRMGKYVLLSNKMETEIVKFRGSTECICLEPGDIIRIDDEVKNFEINYGKVLAVKSSTPDPYITVESNVKMSSIQLGANGGVYLYTNRKQNELENIYDIVRFQTAYQFGEDSDTYRGVVNSDFIDESSLTQIQKMQVTGVTELENSMKLFLDTEDANFENLTGVPTGSFFNIELNNDVDKTYKVIKKTEQENNTFDIEAMQYNLQKFKKIESEDFDDVEITHNIGIPAHTINRPLTPNAVHDQFAKNDLTYAITGEISAQPNSNETSYRVSLYRSAQSGPYIQKEFQRESDDVTSFEINGLIDGTYSVKIAALRNPESSSTYGSTFTIESKRDVYMKPIIKNIGMGHSDSNSYQRISGSGFGVGISNYEDVEYRFVTVDKKDRVFSLTQLDYTLDAFVEKNGQYVLVTEDYEHDVFKFNDIDNAIVFGSYNSGFNMKFDLKKDGTVVDSAFFETTVN